MGAKVLTPAQQRFVVERLAAGDASTAIVQALHTDGVLISEQAVDYYRKRHRVEILAAAREENHLALHAGYAQRGRRVAALAGIVRRCEAALGGEDLPYLRLDTLPLVREMRQALDQIKDEMDDIGPALSSAVTLRPGSDDISLRLSRLSDEELRALAGGSPLWSE